MCGIGGYLGDLSRPRPLLPAALTLRHRGPDEQGSVHFRTAAGVPGYFAAARLGILDLSPAAHQPMASADGQLLLVYNGEIYNHAALRAELLAVGAVFRSHGDTEVVLEGYRLLGAALWPRLRGMFALALWDGTQQLLWLARDPMGIKPLYYTYEGDGDGERLVFASELRALIAAQATTRRLDAQALGGYLTWGSVPEPRALICGVKLLPAGHVLRLPATGSATVSGARLGAAEVRRFAAPLFASAGPGPVLSFSESAARLREALRDTLALHLQADVPLGLVLSGGIDSTALALLLSRANAAPGKDRGLTAFTLGYSPSSGADALSADEAAAQEVEIAAETARLLALRHEVLLLSQAEALAAAPRFLAALDQPSIDGFNTFLICEKVRAAGCKLVLSGLGGDELFGGYALHRSFAAQWALFSRPAQAIGQSAALSRGLYRRLRGLWPRGFLRALLDPALAALVDSADADADAEADDLESLAAEARLCGRGMRAGYFAGLQRVRRLERRNYLRNTLLRDGDVMSMAHGVELRVPLCDQALWSAVLSLGPAALRPQKALLVAAAGAPRVQVLAQKRKRGFVLPLSAWLRGPLGTALAARFSDEALVRAAGLRPQVLSRLLSVYRHAPDPLRRRLTYRIWALHVLLSYVEQHGLRIE